MSRARAESAFGVSFHNWRKAGSPAECVRRCRTVTWFLFRPVHSGR